MLDRLRQVLDALLAVVLSYKALSVLTELRQVLDALLAVVFSPEVVAGWDKVAVSVSASARQLLGWEAPPT